MQKILSLLLILGFCLTSHMAGAQTTILSGVINDSASGKPLAGVSLFLNGTSKGTVTRNDGRFELAVPPGRYELIASAIGYATWLREISSRNLPPSLKIALHTKADELASVTVEPYIKDGWKKYGKTFLQYFIGTTENASGCTIKNKEVLRFHFYLKSNQMSVTAIEPLLIENKALGYELEYRLERFVCDFASNIISWYGYPLFRDMPTDDPEKKKKWENNRQLAYLGSVMHFMRSAYNNRVREEGFLVKYKTPVPNIEKKRVAAIYQPNITKTDSIPMDTLHHYWAVLRQPDYYMEPATDPGGLMTINKDQTHVMFFYYDCTVIYGNPKRGIAYAESAIRLMNQQPIAIDENGSFYPQNEVLNLQTWGLRENISNLLPRDYDINASIP
ncbi:MAG TPA: carboxypeptidase-like regulatory domain-containing protein [Puia sp.]|nr:carboxypeptidase-like regulatory domain-containing protein [Puia sp.]